MVDPHSREATADMGVEELIERKILIIEMLNRAAGAKLKSCERV
jgi:hypothetical protein